MTCGRVEQGGFTSGRRWVRRPNPEQGSGRNSDYCTAISASQL